MAKPKLFIVLILSALLVVAAVLGLVSFGPLNWIKLLVLIPLFAAAFFLVSRLFDRYTASFEADIAELKEQLKEKRIKLKEPPEVTGWQGPEAEELQRSLQDLYTRLQEQREQQRSLAEEEAGRQQEAELQIAYGEDDPQREKEIQTIQSNYQTIAQNSHKAFTIADNLSTQAKNAFELSGDVQEGVKVVNNVLHDAAEQSKLLFEQSKKISKIIEIISEISSKTHILSINASIVSARAGKDGKAFEVVSKEIRKLATETDKSLGEIENEILKIQDIIRSVVHGINEANDKTMEERDLLTAVIGALQGVTLGVEVLRAVSNVVNTKTVQQKGLIENIISDYRKMVDELRNAAALRENKPVQWDLDSQLAQINQILGTLHTRQLVP